MDLEKLRLPWCVVDVWISQIKKSFFAIDLSLQSFNFLQSKVAQRLWLNQPVRGIFISSMIWETDTAANQANEMDNKTLFIANLAEITTYDQLQATFPPVYFRVKDGN